LDRLETAPISSVHLWFDRPITDLPHAVLVERLSQWLFNRTALQSSEPPADGRYYYQIVISASRELDGTPSSDTVAAVVDELREIWPAVNEAQLVHSRLVTEHRAVFSVLPGADRYRLPQQSPIENLQFAGDWTRTGWPATMEGAVRSGYLAAENVLARSGRPERLVRSDLRVARLSHWLFGLG
ncbi:MAG: FAD-dependent oxidoreductase, partial [Planctomycetaceae bacterium]